jgi:hypothetical protein
VMMTILLLFLVLVGAGIYLVRTKMHPASPAIHHTRRLGLSSNAHPGDLTCDGDSGCENVANGQSSPAQAS